MVSAPFNVSLVGLSTVPVYGYDHKYIVWALEGYLSELCRRPQRHSTTSTKPMLSSGYSNYLGMQCKSAAFSNNLQFICKSSTNIGRACMPGDYWQLSDVFQICFCWYSRSERKKGFVRNVTNIGVALLKCYPSFKSAKPQFQF